MFRYSVRQLDRNTFSGFPLKGVKSLLITALFLLFATSLSAQTISPQYSGATARSLDQNFRNLLPMIAGDGDGDIEPPPVPVALNDVYQTPMGEALTVNAAQGVLSNDVYSGSGTLEATLVDDTANGTLNLNTDGSFVYTPDAGFSGEDEFTYRAVTGSAESNVAIVTLVVEMAEPQVLEFLTGEDGFTKQVVDNRVRQGHSIQAADFDGDGDLDMVTTNYLDGIVYWYENDGQGKFINHDLDANLEGAYPSNVGDVDGDGDIDIMAGGYLSDTFVWYENDGNANFTRRIIDTQADGAHSILTIDLDGDGDNDFVTTSQDAGNVAWYENDGAQNFTRHIIDESLTGAKRAEVIDVDGDGDLDIVTASYFVNEIAWFENDGSENFSKHVVDDDSEGAYYATPADIDGDGDIDIFAASKLDHTIAWFENDGAQNFTKHVIDDEAMGARTVLAYDMDGDGDIDALAASVEDNTVAWYENDGNGSFTWRPVDLDVGGAYGVFAIDMDFDGDLDVLSAANKAREASVHIRGWNHTGSVNLGGTLLIDSTLLATTAPNAEPAELVYTVDVTPTFGQLRLNNVSLDRGDTFTQDDVDNNRLTYMKNSWTATADAFFFSVRHSGLPGSPPLKGGFTVRVTTQ